MKQIETEYKTYSQQTRKQIKKLCPTALRSVKIGTDYVIKDRDNKTLCTWHKRSFNTGLIVIHNK